MYWIIYDIYYTLYNHILYTIIDNDILYYHWLSPMRFPDVETSRDFLRPRPLSTCPTTRCQATKISNEKSDVCSQIENNRTGTKRAYVQIYIYIHTYSYIYIYTHTSTLISVAALTCLNVSSSLSLARRPYSIAAVFLCHPIMKRKNVSLYHCLSP